MAYQLHFMAISGLLFISLILYQGLCLTSNVAELGYKDCKTYGGKCFPVPFHPSHERLLEAVELMPCRAGPSICQAQCRNSLWGLPLSLLRDEGSGAARGLPNPKNSDALQCIMADLNYFKKIQIKPLFYSPCGQCVWGWSPAV